jgi:hypothetical protein
MHTDKPCDVSGVSNFAVSVEYTLVVILHIFRVGWDDKESIVYLASVGLFVFLITCQQDVYQKCIVFYPRFLRGSRFLIILRFPGINMCGGCHHLVLQRACHYRDLRYPI